MANFRTKARAIDLLGKNQIADLPTAITELWKNGYDAYGDYLDAKLYSSGYKGLEYDVFLLSDDGHGMNEDDILNKWIVIGTDSKRNKSNEPAVEDMFGKDKRVPLGEKGIGRLSVAYLGEHMLMFSKKKNEDVQMLFMNWGVLENYEMFLDDVEIPICKLSSYELINEKYKELIQGFYKNFDDDSWDDFSDLKNNIVKSLTKYNRIPEIICSAIKDHFTKYGHGTLFVVIDPIDELVHLKPETDVDISDNIGDSIQAYRKYMRSTLAGLFNPFDVDQKLRREKAIGDVTTSPTFIIYNPDGTEFDFLSTKNFYTEDDFERCEHWIDGTFDKNGTFTGKIKAFGDVKEYCFSPRIKPRAYIGPFVLKLAFWEGLKANSSMNDEKWDYYTKKGEQYAGLYVYRDGFRVLPYGKEDSDFLEFEKNRSKSAGTYYFSYRKMFGFIGISKNINYELVDKAGREGFVSNESYREFCRILKGFFKQVAGEYFSTKAQTRQDHLNELRKETDRRKIINDERKSNHKKVVELYQTTEKKEQELSNILGEISAFEKEVYKLFNTTRAGDESYKTIYLKADELLGNLKSIKIIVPNSISLYGYDEIADSIYNLNERCAKAEEKVNALSAEISKSVGINALVEQYIKKYNFEYCSLNEEICELIKRIDLAIERIHVNTVNSAKTSLDDLIKYSPNRINLSKDTSQLNISIRTMEASSREIQNHTNTVLIPMVDNLEKMSMSLNWIEILNAFRDESTELRSKMDEVYDLAQVGMAVDIADHQFGALYTQIARDIISIEKMNTNKKINSSINSLKMEFQHLEENYKMLMPLYRKTRMRLNVFSGETIKKTILDFYKDIMDKNKVIFDPTEAFLKYEYNSYESVIIPVFLNVINNALYWVEYADKEKIIQIDVVGNDVAIRNSGAKMSHTELTRCFELFYTKKTTDSGRGIGLFLARKTLNAIDMDIIATNDEAYNTLNGACFVIKKN